MKKTVLALVLLAPLVCQAQLITFSGGSGFTYFDHTHTPVTKNGTYFSLTVDDTKPLEIFDLALEVDGMEYYLDTSRGVNYYHELPLNVGDGMPVLNAAGYFRNTAGETGFEWSLHLEFSMIEQNTSYRVTDHSLENFFAFDTPNITYFGAPFFHRVPEPSALSLIALGLLGLASIKNRKQKNHQNLI